MLLSTDLYIFKCFSTGIGGNAISFVMNIEKINFIEAIKKIAEITNTQIEYTECSEEDLKQWEKEQEQKRSKEEVLQFAHDFFLEHNPHSYLKNRKWRKETIELFEIGFAPKGNLLLKKIQEEKLDLTPFLQFDIIRQSESGSYYDVYQDRIMIPIHDRRGKLVAFTGRNIHSDSKYPKYRNSNDKVYTKGNHFFGLDKAIQCISKEELVYLVEGTPDAIQMYNKGLTNCIASNGTAFTDKQLQLLTNLTKSVCIVPQTDQAGIKALDKIAISLIQKGLNVSVLFPEKLNTDADEYLRMLHTQEDVTNWVCGSEDYILYQLGKSIGNAQESPIQRAEEISKVGELLESIENDILRNSYYEECKTIWKEFGKNYKLKKRKSKVSDALQDIAKNDKSAYFDYGFWEEKGRYMTFQKEDKFAMSNFTMKPLFFIRSNNESKYFLKLQHAFGRTSYTTINTDDIISTGSFRKIAERQGDYHFYGNDSHLYKIKDKLFHDVNRAYEYHTLGQKDDEMYLWANGVLFQDKFFQADKYGIVEITKPVHSLEEFLKLNGGDKIVIHGEKYIITHPTEIVEKVGEQELTEEILKGRVSILSYTYLPSASTIIRGNEGEDNYSEVRKFKFNPEGKLTIEEWSEKMTKVYPKGNGAIAVAWGMMAIFRDIIFAENKNWTPLLFCFGLPRKGKSKIAESIAALSGIPQEDGINLEGGSTDTGIRRFMSSRKNSVIWLNEYKNDLNSRVIGMLKGLADGSGKLQGQKTGGNETTHYKPLSSAVICGQDLPTRDPALLSRCILLELDGQFGSIEDFEDLKEWEKDLDVTYVTAELLQYRYLIKKKYKKTIKMLHNVMRDQFARHNLSYNDRTALNISSILAPFYILSQEGVKFGFDMKHLINELMERTKFHVSIQETASEVEQFFSVIMTSKEIREGYHYKIKKNKNTGVNELFLRVRHVHNFYAEKGKQQDITVLHAGVIESYLKKHIAYIDFTKKTRFKELTNPTSSMIFNYDKLIQHGIEFNTQEIL